VRLNERAERILGRPIVVAIRRVLDRYGAAGGGLLAGGLAYAALFAIVPAMLLLAGVVGLVYADPEARAAAVAVLVGVLPPVRGLIESLLAEAAKNAAPVSVIGAIALIWGTSRFVVAFDEAMSLVMATANRRGAVTRNLAGLATVVLLIGAIPATAALAAAADFLEAGVAAGVLQAASGAIAFALSALPIVATIGATILVYRIVPRPTPSWRVVFVPGLVVGLALTVGARVFVLLAPRLIGAAALLGTVATVFAALAWLALSFQAILIGAAWVRDRIDQAERRQELEATEPA
jgi:membrane protein